ncbi:unnamed protein product [Protopolystoma xenopodis]|uniref:Uncharacterized protein n=1 Tax=Protopolystoma xenopodis TaxID=117903 RepID=A0A3S5A4I0_9PLAT|nr:unnamed protein product [Protopolystoma xenopodis]
MEVRGRCENDVDVVVVVDDDDGGDESELAQVPLRRPAGSGLPVPTRPARMLGSLALSAYLPYPTLPAPTLPGHTLAPCPSRRVDLTTSPLARARPLSPGQVAGIPTQY